VVSVQELRALRPARCVCCHVDGVHLLLYKFYQRIIYYSPVCFALCPSLITTNPILCFYEHVSVIQNYPLPSIATVSSVAPFLPYNASHLTLSCLYFAVNWMDRFLTASRNVDQWSVSRVSWIQPTACHVSSRSPLILCQSRTGFESRTSHDLKWDTIRTLWLRVQIGIKEGSVNYRLLDTLFFTYINCLCISWKSFLLNLSYFAQSEDI
jgi:hypothetical protein